MPTDERVPTVVAEVVNSLSPKDHFRTLRDKPGDWIGAYKLLEEIGEGGCGIVYVAEQQEPLLRRVALKIIKLGMDTDQVIARFEAERQALAMMDHPNIAKIYDAGSTATGRPYFVMELIKGVPITNYCDRNSLSTEERLKLFIQVCQAVQHAHQKGIIHRDIKPSNVLVTLHDDVAVPKVIDFGIAKATTNQRLTDRTLYTALEQFIGTPAYMSPEQAQLSGLDIDTRSDIYALGVLLYELLTGQTPFDSKRLLDAGINEIRRIIIEEDPPRPSTRLSTLAALDQTTIAKRRDSEPPKLQGIIRGDLDWIVMKCLEKSRNRRYATANGLVSDLQRYLCNEPITARPPSVAYCLNKAFRRNRVAYIAAGAVFATAVLGAVVSTWLAVQARKAQLVQSQLREAAEDIARKLTEEKEVRLRVEREKAAESSRASVAETQVSEADAAKALREFDSKKFGRYSPVFDLPPPFAHPDSRLQTLVSVMRRAPESREISTRLLSELASLQFALPMSVVTNLGPQTRRERLSPNDRWFAAISGGQLLVGEMPHLGKGLARVELPEAPDFLTFSENDKQLVVWSRSGSAQVFSLPKTDVWVDLKARGKLLEFSKDSRLLVGFSEAEDRLGAVPAETGTPAIWDPRNGELLRRFEPAIRLGTLASSNDGSKLAGIDGDGHLVLWRSTNSTPEWRQTASFNPTSLRFIMEGHYLLLLKDQADKETRDDQMFQIVEVDSGRAVSVAMVNRDPLGQIPWNQVHPLPSTPDDQDGATTSERSGYSPIPKDLGGKLIASRNLDWFVHATDAGELWVYDNRPSEQGLSGFPLAAVDVDDANLGRPLHFSSDGTRLLLATKRTLKLYRLPQFQLVSSVVLQKGQRVRSCYFGGKGTKALLLMEDSTAKLCSMDPPIATISPVSMSDPSEIMSARLSATGDHALLLERSGFAQVLDLQTGRITRQRLHIGEENVESLSRDWESTPYWPKPWTSREPNEGTVSPSISPDGSMFFNSKDGTNGVLVTLNRSKPETILPHGEFIVWAEFSNDGTQLFSVTKDSNFRTWDTRTGKSSHKAILLSALTFDLCVSPSGKRLLAYAPNDHNSMKEPLRVWSTKDGRLEQTSAPEGQGINNFSWINDEIVSLGVGRQAMSVKHNVFLLADSFDYWKDTFDIPIPRDRELAAFASSQNGRWSVTIRGANEKHLEICENPIFEDPIPTWLPDLFESVLGGRIMDSGEVVRVPAREQYSLRNRILTSSDKNNWSIWCRWLISDRTTKPPSPGLLAKFDGRRPFVATGNHDRHLSTLQLTELAKAKLQLWDRRTAVTNDGTDLVKAIGYLEQAAMLNSNRVAILDVRAAIWRRLGRSLEERVALSEAIATSPHDYSFWLRKLESFAGETNSGNVMQTWLDAREVLFETKRGDGKLMIFDTAAALRAAGLPTEAAKLMAGLVSITPRANDLPPEALDISSYYTSSLNDLSKDLLGSLPPIDKSLAVKLFRFTGLKEFDGVRFDMRGAVRLEQGPIESTRFPNAVHRIPIDKPVRRIHFLHGSMSSGCAEGELAIRFRNGSLLSINLEGRSGVLPGQSEMMDPGLSLPLAVVTNNSSQGRFRIYKSTWTNAQPDLTIKELDFKASRRTFGGSSPLLLSITVEP